MSIEENKAIMQRIWGEILNEGKTENVSEFAANDYVYHGPGGYEIKGTEGLKKLVTWLRTRQIFLGRYVYGEGFRQSRSKG